MDHPDFPNAPCSENRFSPRIATAPTEAVTTFASSMEISFIHYTIAFLASTAALCAIATDRFRNPLAATLAIAGGIAPWLFITIMEADVPPSLQLLGLYGLGGSGPTFLIACLFHWRGGTPNGRSAAVICLVGMIAGFAFNFFTFGAMMSGFR